MGNLRLKPASGAPVEISRDGSVVGRDPSCDIVLADGSVSRKHARLDRRGDSWIVVDQGSANGTFIDSQRVAEQMLRPGQELRFGAIAFRVEVDEPAAEATIIGMAPERPTATVLAAEPMVPRAPAPPAPPRPSPPPPPAPRAAPPPPPPAGRVGSPSAPPRPPSPPGRSPVPQMAAPSSPPKKKGPWLWVGLGCCGCLLILGLIGGAVALFGGGVFALTEAPVAAVRAELELIRGGNVDGAYAALAESYRSELSAEAFAQLVSTHASLRANSGFTASSRSVQNDTATISGQLQSFEGSSDPGVFRLRSEGGTWRITSIEIGSLSE